MQEITVLALGASELGSLLNGIGTIGYVRIALKSVLRECVVQVTLLTNISVILGGETIGDGLRILSLLTTALSGKKSRITPLADRAGGSPVIGQTIVYLGDWSTGVSLTQIERRLALETGLQIQILLAVVYSLERIGNASKVRT